MLHVLENADGAGTRRSLEGSTARELPTLWVGSARAAAGGNGRGALKSWENGGLTVV